MSDFWISVCIATPLVLIPLIWFLRSSYQADKKEADALASRLPCPACGTFALVWEGKHWAVEVCDGDEEGGGYGILLRCQQCKVEHAFTHDGEPFTFPPDDDEYSDP